MIILLMLKQKIKRIPLRRIAKLPVLISAVIVVSAAFAFPRVKADQFTDKINALQAENTANRNIVAQLQNQAISYQDAINRLQAQIVQLQGQINDNVAQQANLQDQITAAQAELNKQKKLLGENIKAMYVEGQISTLEMLASSKDLSEFVDKQQYRSSVQDKIKTTLEKIITLKQQLRAQKGIVDRLLEEQRVQQSQLAEAKSQQSLLLTYNQGQQAEYNQKTKDNQKKISQLLAEQAAVNCRGGCSGLSYDPNNGYYPYANWPFSMSTAPGCVDGDGPDRWGYCTRQCVSYTAWAVERSGRTAPRYYGDAKNWVYAAQVRGVPVYTSDPQPGDIAISTAGTWGHSMYVEAVSGGQIYVSQYNLQLDGRYTTQWRGWSGLYFLRFP